MVYYNSNSTRSKLESRRINKRRYPIIKTVESGKTYSTQNTRELLRLISLSFKAEIVRKEPTDILVATATPGGEEDV
ncbi:hypothetical protein evm_014598 [Chilo suppressalis]|nr:hypothetical protein evm_014598 [Chilo suppressalis]